MKTISTIIDILAVIGCVFLMIACIAMKQKVGTVAWLLILLYCSRSLYKQVVGK